MVNEITLDFVLEAIFNDTAFNHNLDLNDAPAGYNGGIDLMQVALDMNTKIGDTHQVIKGGFIARTRYEKITNQTVNDAYQNARDSLGLESLTHEYVQTVGPVVVAQIPSQFQGRANVIDKVAAVKQAILTENPAERADNSIAALKDLTAYVDQIARDPDTNPIAPGLITQLHTQVVMLYKRAGRPGDAEDHYQNTDELDPNFLNSSQRNAVEFELGIAPKRTIEELEAGYRTDPRDLQTLKELRDAYVKETQASTIPIPNTFRPDAAITEDDKKTAYSDANKAYLMAGGQMSTGYRHRATGNIQKAEEKLLESRADPAAPTDASNFAEAMILARKAEVEERIGGDAFTVMDYIIQAREKLPTSSLLQNLEFGIKELTKQYGTLANLPIRYTGMEGISGNMLMGPGTPEATMLGPGV